MTIDGRRGKTVAAVACASVGGGVRSSRLVALHALLAVIVLAALASRADTNVKKEEKKKTKIIIGCPLPVPSPPPFARPVISFVL